jgi:hypothetical protein
VEDLVDYACLADCTHAEQQQTHARQARAEEIQTAAAENIPPAAASGATGKLHTVYLFLLGCL